MKHAPIYRTLCLAVLGLAGFSSVAAQDPACEASDGESGAQLQFIDDIFSLTQNRVIGWREDPSVGLYGFGPLAFEGRVQTHVRSIRELTGLDLTLVANGGQVNIALVYANFRSLTADPSLGEFVTAMGGANSRLFASEGPLQQDDDGYHYHFRLNESQEEIALAAVFIDKRRFSRLEAEGLLAKGLFDAMVVGATSNAIEPSFRNEAADVLTYLEECPRIPRADLNLLDQIYEPSVQVFSTNLEASALNDQPLELLR